MLNPNRIDSPPEMRVYLLSKNEIHKVPLVTNITLDVRFSSRSTSSPRDHRHNSIYSNIDENINVTITSIPYMQYTHINNKQGRKILIAAKPSFL